MSSITPFGTVTYGNEQSLTDWIGAHALHHLTEYRALSRTGQSMSVPILNGALDHDWFGRHALAHAGMKNVSQGGAITHGVQFSAAGSSVLPQKWMDAAQFYDWMRAHTLIHAQTDRQLGIATG